jgi:hypothetical protein
VRTANKSQIRVYDLADPPIRQATVFDWTLAANSGGSPLARELCFCLSYFATRNLKRQRGRIYLGPLTTTSVENRTGDQGVTTAARNAVCAAASALATPSAGATWVVYSEREHEAVGAEYGGLGVTEGWVDHALDIQRRRGRKPEQRTVWT